MSHRVIVRAQPLNAETPLTRHGDAVLTPNERHYVRSHFATPAPPAHLRIIGLVERAIDFSPAEVRAFPARTMAVTLECAGNGRVFLEPPTPGEQWGLGAVSTATWTGARLRDLLERAAPKPEAREVLFRGADRGTPDVLDHEIAFERSLPITDALADDVLVAYEMNGLPLPPEHGYPLRLIVPGRYGVASVKWLADIEVVADAFRGFFQAQRYVVDGKPLGPIEPRAVIVSPEDGAKVDGSAEARGFAWSGYGPIAKVELSTDGGATWSEARLGEAPSRWSWRPWSARLAGPAREVVLVARATDQTGRTQPLSPSWNALGYRNNAVRPLRARIE